MESSNPNDETVALAMKNCTTEEEKQAFFFYAAETGDWLSLAKLIKSGEYDKTFLEGFDCHRYTSYSMTPLHVAAEYGRQKCVELFIHYGIYVNSKDKYHRTPLHLAAENGKYHCLKLLLEAGADVSACTKLPHFAHDEWHKRPHIPYNTGTTALQVAVKNNEIDCIKELIRFGADPSAADQFATNSLHIAVKSGVDECVLALLSGIRDKAALSIPTRFHLATPLHTAIDKGMIDSVKELVRLGSDLNAVNSSRFTPLSLLCSSQKFDLHTKKEILRIMILEGDNADLNERLFRCQSDARLKAFLIAYGADIGETTAKPIIKGLENKMFILLREQLCAHVYPTFPTLPRFPTLLKFLVNLLPRVPSLQALKSYFAFKDSLREADEIWHGSVLPDDVYFRLVQRKENLYVKMSKISEGIKALVSVAPYYDNVTKYEKLIPLQQPFVNLVYERITEEVKNVNTTNWTSTFGRLHVLNHLALQQFLWYYNAASNPRTLQQHCRIVIRNQIALSNINIMFITELPLPKKLKSYLLFECDEEMESFFKFSAYL